MAEGKVTGGSARFDRGFLEALEQDPATVLRAYGIEATPEILDAIQEMDFAQLYRVADAFAGAAPAKPIAGEIALGVEAPIERMKDEVALVFP
jgi:hypothetical protein